MKPPKQIDFYQLVSLNVNSLKWFGLWFYIPYPTLSVQFWLHVFVRVASGIVVFTIPPMGQMAYLVKLLLSGKYEILSLASSVNLMMTESLASIKLADLLFRRDLLSKLIDQVIKGDFPRTEAHSHILQHGINLSRWIFICLLIGAGTDVFCKLNQ
ncbi:uncharacterized protein [Choristoneura fumiferana]|uniref:uncharacterized protein n=1 Tax=Choristoneura fumiferana TaxID=7141 RepID=UPI003D1586DF